MKQKLRKTVCMSLVGVMTFTSIWSNDMTIQAASKPKKITMNKKKITLEVGKTFKLKVKTVKPKKASKAVTYKSNKKSVATVSKKGVVKGKKNRNSENYGDFKEKQKSKSKGNSESEKEANTSTKRKHSSGNQFYTGSKLQSGSEQYSGSERKPGRKQYSGRYC